MAKRGSWSAVYDWMLDLDLTASELLIYSRIVSFSGSEVGGFIGKVDSLAQWGRCTRQYAHKVLNTLISRGLVQKSHVKTDMGTVIKYTANCQLSLHQCQHSLHDSQLSLQSSVNSVDTNCQLSTQPTLYNKNIYNNTIIGGGSNIDTSVEPPPPPTVEEVRNYCREIGSGVDPQRFWDYYSLRKWRWREGPITEPEAWQAVLRLWESSGRDEKQTDKQDKPFCGGSFDTDEFFAAALAKSYEGK